MEDVARLAAERDRIEAELAAAAAALAGMGGDVHGPLVDRDGFPRADVDVYQVRTLRHRMRRTRCGAPLGRHGRGPDRRAVRGPQSLTRTTGR
jgi:hypothetical protein